MDLSGPAAGRRRRPLRGLALTRSPANSPGDPTGDPTGDTAGELAARLLVALGCRPAPESFPRGGRLDGGHPRSLRIGPVRAGEGGSPPVRPVTVSLDWAGPVALPLRDELGVQAACGIMHVHGRRYGRPTPLGVDYAGAVAGVLAAQGAIAAVLAQLRGTPVTQVGTSVAEAALLSVTQYLAAATADDDWPEPHAPGGPPFRSADGVWFEIETLAAEGWREFWRRLGAPGGAVGGGWRAFEQRFATACCPLPAALHDTVAGLPYTACAAAATAAGVTIVPLAPLTAPPAHPAPPAAGPAATEPAWWITPGTGTARTAGGPPAPATPPPDPGAGPLRGITVLEVCRRVQGPMAGHLLHLLGATVIRVEPPGGDPLRGVPPMAGDCSARFLALNRGKRVVHADLGSARSRAGLVDVVDGCAVVLHSLAPGKAERAGLGAGELCRHRPGLVHATASGWGRHRAGQAPIGTDYVVQAGSGLAARIAGRPGPPAPSLMTVTDVFGGLLCALAVLAALAERCRTGAGGRVETSLLGAATLLAGLPGPAGAGREVPAPGVPVRTDLAALAEDPRFAPALTAGRPTHPRPPWRFSP